MRDSSLEERGKSRGSATVRIGRPQETVSGMMAQIDPTQFPHKLIRIESLPEVTAADRFVHQPGQ